MIIIVMINIDIFILSSSIPVIIVIIPDTSHHCHRPHLNLFHCHKEREGECADNQQPESSNCEINQLYKYYFYLFNVVIKYSLR